MPQEDFSRQAFYEEANDLLSELETALLELEETPDDQDLIDRIFRAMHTIKGSGAMFGFDDIAAFTHDVENLFEYVRDGKLSVSRQILDLTLKSKDHINYLLDISQTGEQADLENAKELTTQLKALIPDAQSQDEAPQAPTPADLPEGEEASASVTYRVRFKPEPDIFLSGSNPIGLIEELCELGYAQVFPHLENIPTLDDIDPESFHMWWDIILTTTEGEDAIRDVFLFVEDDCELVIKLIDQSGLIEGQDTYKKLGEILVERGDITQQDLKKILEEKQLLGTMLTNAGVVSEEKVQSALAEQQAVQQIREKKTAARQPREVVSSIRVAADKLDYLVDLVGELVIVQAQISQLVSERNDQTMLPIAEELERLSDELRDSTLGIRMLPIGTTFSKFRRLVRDLSSDLGKEIELTTEGAETELDKTVIERLNDPLVHLLRNSIDHGVEIPADRKEKGKSPVGSILLVAEHSGGEVHIRIKDDGKGLDAEAIREKAIERGLITADQELSEKEIFANIFLPGFSTAKAITNVSGRGVGLDVVKKSIEELRGSIEIDSKVGVGTTFTIKLPLTLAIIEGLQVVIGDEFFVIPLSLVEECVELASQTDEKSNEQILNLRGEIVPYIRLRDWFEVPGDAPQIEQIVVVGVQGARIGLVVDNVIGEHQTVIKSLGKVYKDVEGISGATIKGDGTMALIIDIPQLIQTVSASRHP